MFSLVVRDFANFAHISVENRTSILTALIQAIIRTYLQVHADHFLRYLEKQSSLPAARRLLKTWKDEHTLEALFTSQDGVQKLFNDWTAASRQTRLNISFIEKSFVTFDMLFDFLLSPQVCLACCIHYELIYDLRSVVGHHLSCEIGIFGLR